MVEDFLKGDGGSVFLFLYLLPGFLGSVVYDYLVEREKPTNFDRVIDALVLTFTSALIVHVCFNVPLLPNISGNEKNSISDVIGVFLTTSIIYVLLFSVLISIVFAFLNNHDVIYYLLNRIGLTYKNGGWDVWQDTFYKHKKYWISIRYVDGRYLVGWPKYYSPTGKPREIFVADATWWEPDATGVCIPIDVIGAGVYVSDFSQVIAIELLE